MIELEQVYKTYQADGTQRQWSFPYQYNKEDNITLYVEHNGVLSKINSSLYEFDSTTKNITYPKDALSDPVPAGDTVLIYRDTDLTQEEDSSTSNFKSNDIERMVDKLTMICQELSDKYSRTISFNPTEEYNTSASYYIETINDAKDTAVEKAGDASTSATNAATSETKAQKWAEGTDAQVEALDGEHSAKGWATIAQAAAESEAVQTVAANIEDVNTVAYIQPDVTNVASISTAVSTVSAHDTEVTTVYDNLASVMAVSGIKEDVTAVAGIKDDVTAVSGIKTAVTNVNSNSTNINKVAANESNINAVAANETNINAVNSNKTNIDNVAAKLGKIEDVADDLTKIEAVHADLTNIDAVADDLTNIDIAVANLSDLQDKQNKTLTTSLTIGGVTQTTVEGALGALNIAKQDNITVINGGDSTNA